MLNSKDDTRNYSIDLLRIIAMYMIVILHTLGHGGLLDVLEYGTINHAMIWLLETIAFCSVNIYGLISGYVGYEKNLNYLIF